MASLPVVVHEPLTLTSLEHSAVGGGAGAEGSSFFQLVLQNTSPLPLHLKEPTLSAAVGLDRLHGDIPQVNTCTDWMHTHGSRHEHAR